MSTGRGKKLVDGPNVEAVGFGFFETELAESFADADDGAGISGDGNAGMFSFVLI
ncbi:MAG: hypothetical protein NTX61_12975 [Bacteroidetes bacterium]|nr:hypothetical protein [Bacteroidota bacterium]